MNQSNQLNYMAGHLELLRACASERPPEVMLDRVCKIISRFVNFGIVTFTEYAPIPGTSKAVMALGRYAVDGGRRFDWPARWLRIPSAANNAPASSVLLI